MIDIQKMEQAALAATQGEWISQHWSKDASDVQLKSENTYTTLAINCSMDDATYIATANPSAVLELITRLKVAEQDAARWKAFSAEAERDYVEVSASEEPYYQRFECAAAMEEFVDAAMKESK